MKGGIVLLIALAQFAWAQQNVALLNIDSYRDSRLATSITGQHYSSVPFQLIDGMILVEASVNGREGLFILDTGAPALILNRAGEPDNSYEKVRGLGLTGGSFELSTLAIEELKIGDISRNRFKGYAMDIGHLEKDTGKSLLGLIGYDFFRDYELLIDYGRQELFFLKLPKSALHRSARPLADLHFEMIEHLPVIKVIINGQELRFGLDTGSEVNIMDDRWTELLSLIANNTPPHRELQGVGKSILQAAYTEGLDLVAGGMKFEGMGFHFSNLSHLTSRDGRQLDGILGYPFFARTRISINYRKQRIYFWAEPASSELEPGVVARQEF